MSHISTRRSLYGYVKKRTHACSWCTHTHMKVDEMASGELRERARRTISAPSMPLRADVSRTGLAVVTDLLAGAENPKMLDLEIRTSDQEVVRTSSFILASRSPVFAKEIFTDNGRVSTINCSMYSSKTVRAALRYVFTNDLKETGVDQDNTVEGMTTLVQLVRFGKDYAIDELNTAAFRFVRQLMIKMPPLAIVAYNLINKDKMDAEIESFALQVIEDDPITALFRNEKLGPGVKYFDAERLEDFMQVDSVELEEILMFETLLKWSELYPDQLDTAESFSCFVDLRFIEPSELLTVVQDSELFSYEQVLEAAADQALIAQMEGKLFSNYRGPKHMERVVVSNAGNNDVNGVYRKKKHASPDEPIYSKQSERQGGEYGLYYWSNSWHLAPAADLSNVCYSCKGDLEHVPRRGWESSSNGQEPGPVMRVIDAINAETYQSIRNSLPACYRTYEEFLGN